MNKIDNKKQKPMAKRNLTEQEQASIIHMKEKGHINSDPLFRSFDAEHVELAIDKHLDRNEAIDLLESRILEVTGYINSNIGIRLLTNIHKALIPKKAEKDELVNQLNMIAHSMQALQPADEYEGQLIAQLIVLHEHSLELLGRAMRSERVDFANIYLNGASKLLARHHETLEVLQKYRRKGEQRVHVEHVHVHSGAQAIVGTINTGGGLNH